MFIKKLLPILAFAAFTTQPIFAADSSNASTTGTSTTGSSTTGTSGTDSNATGASATGTSTPDATSTTPATSTSTTTNTSAASSQDNDDGDENGQACNCHKKNMMKMAEELQLTSAQKDQMKAIKDKAKASLQSSKDQMQSIRSQIHNLITSSSMDNSKLDSLISQKTTLLGNMIKVKIDAKHQMYMVLNPQQQQKFQQMMQDELKPHSCH